MEIKFELNDDFIKDLKLLFDTEKEEDLIIEIIKSICFAEKSVTPISGNYYKWVNFKYFIMLLEKYYKKRVNIFIRRKEFLLFKRIL